MGHAASLSQASFAWRCLNDPQLDAALRAWAGAEVALAAGTPELAAPGKTYLLAVEATDFLGTQVGPPLHPPRVSPPYRRGLCARGAERAARLCGAQGAGARAAALLRAGARGGGARGRGCARGEHQALGVLVRRGQNADALRLVSGPAPPRHLSESQRPRQLLSTRVSAVVNDKGDARVARARHVPP
jgi:hypothetical protein